MNFFILGARERIKKDHYLMKIDKLIDWRPIESALHGIHVNDIDPKGGPKGYNKLSMFKAMLLGQWHSLSDPGLEEALRLRIDFMIFTGFEMAKEAPDETTLCRFRNKLIAKKLHEALFKEVNRQLERHGLKVKEAEAALIDATIIASAARPKTTIEQRDGEVKKSADPDATWVTKGSRSYFGYRGYLMTDGGEGFIQHLCVLPANQSEMKQLPRLLDHVHGKRVLTDKGFSCLENRDELARRGLKSGLSHKASRNHPLRWSQRLFNKIIAKRRFRIEQAFGTLKRRFSMRRASYLGQAKVEAQLYWKAICFNLTKAMNKMCLA